MASWKINRFVVAIVAVILAAALRAWPLDILGERVVWLTFYPAITVAAVYGGFFIGLLATVLSCITVVFFWPLLVTHPFIKDFVDWLGLSIYFLNCMIISVAAEAMLRANIRAKIAQKQAEESNKAKSVFLANMSHELRTPLNAILGFSDLLRNDAELSEKQRDNLNIINRSGEHLLKLINDVLDMAKVEAGRVAIEISAFDLKELVRDVTDLMAMRAEEKGLGLMLEQSPDFPRFVRADEAKLRQVLINLIGNAIKFTGHGTVTLRMNAQSAGNRLMLDIAVEDSGSGIATGDIEHIFEPFIQVGKPATQKGTGLGLTITREFVELMGGQITVESVLGAGSKFRVKIPVEYADTSEVSSTENPGKRVVSLASGQPEFRILIVEDQEENWLLLKRLLEDSGFRVRVAENGAEGIKAFSVWRPHFIWMDIRMPVMDGLEATRQIRALEGGQEVRIVALTASVFAQEHENILAAGMDDLIRKPFRSKEIFDCLSRFLGARYIYSENETTPIDKPSSILNAEALATLPETLRNGMIDALTRLDARLLGAHIDRIAKLDPALAEILKDHADKLAYTAILHALQQDKSIAEQVTNHEPRQYSGR